MTLVLIGKGLVLGGWPSKIEVIWVTGNTRFQEISNRTHFSRTPKKPEYEKIARSQLRGPLVMSHSIFDG